jgi:hypothetical protein
MVPAYPKIEGQQILASHCEHLHELRGSAFPSSPEMDAGTDVEAKGR